LKRGNGQVPALRLRLLETRRRQPRDGAR